MPVPGAPGAYQVYGMTGLASETRYYFAVRSQDVAGNWSPISNVVNVLASLDQTSPATIIDLSAR